jgi:Uma2 family endonuclease
MQSTLSPTPTHTRRRRPAAFVVRDPPPDEIDAQVDWSAWYLTDEEDMGQNVEQADEIHETLSALEVLAEERGWKDVLCASDSFFAWIEAEPLVRVSPDVYLLDHPPPRPWPKMWQTWVPGHKAPRWALEIVSDDWKKDYEDNPPKYAQLGTRELVIFDPQAAAAGPNGNGAPVRVPLQVYRRGADGAFVRVYRGNGPAHSEELDAWLVVQRDGGVVRIRIARDTAGADIVPTALEAKRASDEKSRLADEARRVADEARIQAEERLRVLEAELRKLAG